MDKTLYLVDKTDLAQLSKTDIFDDVADIQAPDLRPHLVIIIGHDIGAHYRLKPGKMTIGRSRKSDIIINDSTISRIHCSIELKNDIIFVDDLGSANGVYVNSQKIKRVELKPGVILQLGKTALQIEYKNQFEIQTEKELSRKASTDDLTGIPNFKHFTNLASLEFNYALRHHLTVGVILVDINKFSKVNEKFGYQIGDFVLIQVAKMIRETICETEILGRYEQDKFIILPQAGTKKEKMYLLCEQIRNTIENLKIGEAKNPIKITVSIGFHISDIENDNFNTTFNDLTERTVQALHYAKKRKGIQIASLL